MLENTYNLTAAALSIALTYTMVFLLMLMIGKMLSLVFVDQFLPPFGIKTIPHPEQSLADRFRSSDHRLQHGDRYCANHRSQWSLEKCLMSASVHIEGE